VVEVSARQVHVHGVPGQELEPAISPWLILVVLIGTMLGFVGSTLYAQRASAAVDDDAISIATNAAPAIEHLAGARGELGRIAAAAASVTSGTGPPARSEVAVMEAAASRLRGHLFEYLQQPFYPTEEVRYAEVERDFLALQDRIADLATAVRTGDRDASEEKVRIGVLPAIARVDRAVAALVVFNTQQQHRLGLEIPRRRRHANRIGYLLQAATAILGLFLMSLVVRGIRAYQRLLTRARAATRARDDVLATVSHDLKNPIHVITLTTRSLRRASPDARTAELAARLDRAIDRMTRLIANLLDAARIEAGELHADRKPEDAASLVEAAAELLRAIAEEKSIHVSAAPPPRGVVVPCERHLVLRVFANLIGNAIKFSPQGGSIVVAAEPLSGGVRFSVRDHGPGIPAEHRRHVFDRYWQQRDSDRRGSGLGLYIAKGIVEAHGGRIWIEDAAPGTSVCFTLPSPPA
jgi:signal transduction histidine kinase